MLNSWEQVEKEYNAIKDHKPRFTHKLAALGEVLASAYLLDKNRAVEMWSYILDMNDINMANPSYDASAKFYVYYISNKIYYHLTNEQAFDFLWSTPKVKEYYSACRYVNDKTYVNRCSDTIINLLRIGNHLTAFQLAQNVINELNRHNTSGNPSELFFGYHLKRLYEFAQPIYQCQSYESSSFAKYLQALLCFDDNVLSALVCIYHFALLPVLVLKNAPDTIDILKISVDEIRDFHRMDLYNLYKITLNLAYWR